MSWVTTHAARIVLKIATRSWVAAYLLHEDVNVIVVGWGILAADVYPVAANNTRRVGEFLGDFLEFLNRESNLEYKDVHISGHSLGSHVAGFAGAYLDGRIGRITGALQSSNCKCLG